MNTRRALGEDRCRDGAADRLRLTITPSINPLASDRTCSLSEPQLLLEADAARSVSEHAAAVTTTIHRKAKHTADRV
jgi:hypothetical protein